MKIEIDSLELARLSNHIAEQAALIIELQRRGTELVEENRALRQRLKDEILQQRADAAKEEYRASR